MNEPHDPQRAVDEVPSPPPDSLDAGPAARFDWPAEGPSRTLDEGMPDTRSAAQNARQRKAGGIR
jgi:hypothetical protein